MSIPTAWAWAKKGKGLTICMIIRVCCKHTKNLVMAWLLILKDNANARCTVSWRSGLQRPDFLGSSRDRMHHATFGGMYAPHRRSEACKCIQQQVHWTTGWAWRCAISYVQSIRSSLERSHGRVLIGMSSNLTRWNIHEQHLSSPTRTWRDKLDCRPRAEQVVAWLRKATFYIQ